jgi:hypothetical protein
MNRKMATYLRFGPVLALLAIVLAVTLLPAGRASALTAAVVVTVNPARPGELADYTIAFTTSLALPAQTGVINITFDKDILMPEAISRNAVLITSSILGGAAGGTALQAVNLTFDPTITVDPSPTAEGRKTVVLKVPDMDPATTAGAGSGVQDIAATAAVTVTFTQAAGIRNPLAAVVGNEIHVTTNAAGDVAGPGVLGIFATTRNLTLSSIDGSRGATITATGKGFKKNLTATVWLDNGVGVGGVADDGIKNGTEPELATALVGADGTFTATFAAGGNLAVATNQINATDGSTPTADNSVPVAANPTWRLRGKVSVSPATATRGQTVTAKFADFAAGAALNSLTIGGIAPAQTDTAPELAALLIGADGTLTFNITIPVTVGLGPQEVRGGAAAVGVVAADSGRTSTMTITGAPVTANPSTVIHNQDLTLSGSSFTPSSTAGGAGTNGVHQILAGGIIVGGVALTTANSGIAFPINLDSGGSWVVTGRVPSAAGDIAAITAGTQEVRITDSGGRLGVATVTIPARTLTLSPAVSRRRSDLTIKGAGFPATNSLSPIAPSVNITYAGTVASANPDSSGSFSVVMKVPVDAGIPSDNTVTATVLGTTTTVTHVVPGASITISPTKGVPGTKVTLNGLDFPGFASLGTLTIGGRNAIPSPAPDTTREGGLTVSATVPDLDEGIASVIVIVGGTSANVGFEVTVAPVAPPAPPPALTVAPATALAPLGANLVRTWGYNAATQKFQLYDPAAALLSDLSALNRGAGYWINVKAAQTVTLGSGSFSLSAGWNLIGWLG